MGNTLLRKDRDDRIKDREQLRTGIKKIRKIVYQAPLSSPDEEAVQILNICTEVLKDEENTSPIAP